MGYLTAVCLPHAFYSTYTTSSNPPMMSLMLQRSMLFQMHCDLLDLPSCRLTFQRFSFHRFIFHHLLFNGSSPSSPQLMFAEHGHVRLNLSPLHPLIFHLSEPLKINLASTWASLPLRISLGPRSLQRGLGPIRHISLDFLPLHSLGLVIFDLGGVNLEPGSAGCRRTSFVTWPLLFPVDIGV